MVEKREDLGNAIALMSLYVMAFMGMAPVGSLASRIGAPNTLIIGGASCIIGSFLARKLPLIMKMVRPIYVRKGILSEKSEKKIETDH